jgi:hypothetical protein
LFQALLQRCALASIQNGIEGEIRRRVGLVGRHQANELDLTNDADGVRAILVRTDPGAAGQYPVGCVLPSFDGQHLDFSFQPDCVEQSSGRLVRAAFRGVLFFFSVRVDVRGGNLIRSISDLTRIGLCQWSIGKA